MSHAVKVFLFTFGLFLGMLLFLELGGRIGTRRVKEAPKLRARVSALSTPPSSPFWDF